jgi:hypothetical protein
VPTTCVAPNMSLLIILAPDRKQEVDRSSQAAST